MRLIDADRFEKEVMEKCGDNPAMFYYFSEVCGIARMQPTIEVPQWIPCSDRLPEEPEENFVFDNKQLELYLVSEKNADYPFRAFWNGKNFTDGFGKLDVIAWQPLPSAWKGENNAEK